MEKNHQFSLTIFGKVLAILFCVVCFFKYICVFPSCHTPDRGSGLRIIRISQQMISGQVISWQMISVQMISRQMIFDGSISLAPVNHLLRRFSAAYAPVADLLLFKRNAA